MSGAHLRNAPPDISALQRLARITFRASQPGTSDERAGFIEQGFDAAPLGEEHLQLCPGADCFPPGKGDHAGTVAADGGDFGAVDCDVAVAGDDQPSAPGELGYPLWILGGWQADS